MLSNLDLKERTMKRFSISTLVLGLALLISVTTTAQQKLHLKVYVASENGWCVTSTLISGKTESILVDTQFLKSEANQVADLVGASGTHLKAVIITHPHDDHYMGMGVIHERFPQAPIYMTAAAIEQYKSEYPQVVGWLKKNMPAEAPSTMPIPDVLPGNHFTVDGQAIEIMQGQGDEAKTLNNFLWIPSLRAVITGDMVFNGVHAWLANSTPESRAAWLESLNSLTRLHPQILVAGHKKNDQTADSPAAIEATARYIRDFDQARQGSANANDLVAAMKTKYPDLALPDKILWQAARRAFPRAN
jgi:glyoxylase-like metal-dependent hydrolase (beta-lactamase superfamily II)